MPIHYHICSLKSCFSGDKSETCNYFYSLLILWQDCGIWLEGHPRRLLCKNYKLGHLQLHTPGGAMGMGVLHLVVRCHLSHGQTQFIEEKLRVGVFTECWTTL